MHDDYSLLRRFADRRDHAAFAELVERYVHFVYDCTLRRAHGDAHAAADATETVFAQLARHAGKLAPDTVLAGWLHGATRNAVGKLISADDRPKAHPQTSARRRTPEGSDAEWDALRPVLDDAVDELLESERTPLILRFFRRLSFAEIGAALALTEDAARVRAERAVERLRALLAKRGITSTPAGLAASMSTAPAFPAPDGLPARIAATAGAAGESSTFADTLTSFLSAKTASAAIVVGALAFAGGFWLGTRPARESVANERGLKLAIAELRDDNGRLNAQVATLTAEIEQMKRAATEAAARKSLPAPFTPPRSATVETAPPAATDVVPDFGGKTDAVADAHFQDLKRRVEPALERAIAAYRAAHQGNNPTGPQELVPYFSTPQEGADFIEFVDAGKGR